MGHCGGGVLTSTCLNALQLCVKMTVSYFSASAGYLLYSPDIF